MNLGPVTKLDKRNKTTSKKKLAMTSCIQIVSSLHFFDLLAIWSFPEAGFEFLAEF